MMYPSAAYQIVGFPANPGDSISAQVAYVGPTTVKAGKHQTATGSIFQLTIINNRTGAKYVVPTSYTTTTSAAQSSAEWIVEAPWSGSTLPLADFSPVNFSGCKATGNRGYGPITTWPCDQLTMLDPSGGEATPSATDGTSFTVNWQSYTPPKRR